jgi:hypothetical protein
VSKTPCKETNSSTNQTLKASKLLFIGKKKKKKKKKKKNPYHNTIWITKIVSFYITVR